MNLLVERKEHKRKKARLMTKPSVLCSTGGFCCFGGDKVKLALLADKFYAEYSGCREILQKRNRPYACLTIEVDGVLFAIPFRHHIGHRYAFITYDDCGLYYTKAVVVKDKSYLDGAKPTIERKEWDIIRKNESKILYEFKGFVNQYRRAMQHRDNPRSKNLLKYSALQYFEDFFE